MTEDWVQMREPYSDYMISNLGRFKRIGGRFTKTTIHGTQNMNVALANNITGKRTTVLARKLIAEYFVDGYYDGVGIRHIDGDRGNIAAHNLQLFNPKEECEVLYKPTKAQIMEGLNQFKSVQELADEFGIVRLELDRLITQYELRGFLADKTVIGDNNILPTVTFEGEESVEIFSIYRVYNTGKVVNIKTGSVLKTSIVRGITRYSMYDSGKLKRLSADKLIATLFVPNPYNYKFVRFIDGNPLNLRCDNLVWIPRSDRRSYAKEFVYHSETEPLVREFLERCNTISITGYSVEKGLCDTRLVSLLRVYGFPTDLKVLRHLIDKHSSLGTYGEFISGRLNINRVELFEGEVRRPVEQFPGYYITNYGRLISHKVFTKEQIIKPNFNGRALKLAISIHNRRQYVLVKSLVAKAFLPNTDNLTRIAHIDGDRMNCRLDNLKWVSEEEFAIITKLDKIKNTVASK